MPFVNDLFAATTLERAFLFASPRVGEEPSGHVSRESYVAFLMQEYCYVSRSKSVPVVVAAALVSRHEPIREVALAYGRELGERADRLVADMTALGIEPTASARCAPTPETSALIRYVAGHAARGCGPGLLGWIYVAEGSVASLLAIATDCIQRAVPLPASSFGYLRRSHRAMDPANTRRLAALLEGLTRADDRAVAIRSAMTAYELYARVLRSRPGRRSRICRDALEGGRGGDGDGTSRGTMFASSP